MSDILQETINTLTELKRMHQLNFELLEQLNIACQWIVDNGIEIPNDNALHSLVGKSLALLAEIQADEPKTLIYKKIADESLHEHQNSHELDSTLKKHIKALFPKIIAILNQN